MIRKLLLFSILMLATTARASKPTSKATDVYPEDLVWTAQSHNSSESMPCGGGTIGLNVWVENNDILFYVCRSGSFDENNTLLKAGRFRLRLIGNKGTAFSQRLCLKDGYVEITMGNATVNLWADVFHPIVHLDIESTNAITAEVAYESWRYRDRDISHNESFQTSYKFGVPAGTVTRRDSIRAERHSVTFFHANADSTVFDATVSQQKLNAVKSELYNPLGRLISGGMMWGDDLVKKGEAEGKYSQTDYRSYVYAISKAKKKIRVNIALNNQPSTIESWQQQIDAVTKAMHHDNDLKASRTWWNQYWQRSFIKGSGASAEYTRNYTLFRYMMGCNSQSQWPTKFNGGLFCFDPEYVGHNFSFTPDYRRWGGGTHTAQNQRLLYWPMLKSGDWDIMRQQLDFYLRILHTAELRSQTYWQHGGACFTEQIENFGLPEYDEYGKDRPDDFDPGIQYNKWLEYTWDTVLEICQMALDCNLYADVDIAEYIPLICSSLDFFDLHYRYLARKRGICELDQQGHLILYPSSGAETYKMAYNSTSTIAGLKTVAASLIDYLSRNNAADTLISKYKAFSNELPDINFRYINGHKTISPAMAWSRINNTEPIQLYPVFPWRMYGVGRDDIETALNTWRYDDFVCKNKGYISWEQANIFAACLGQTSDAAELTKKKLGNGPHRFTAFWGPGHDWTPDHNWGGSGMIGLQEMLLQEVGDTIYLFPAWPKEWDVHFRLHLKHNTTVEAKIENGIVTIINISPAARRNDIICKY